MALFPEDIYYNAKNRWYLATKINEFVRVSALLGFVQKRNGNFQYFLENSRSVARREN